MKRILIALLIAIVGIGLSWQFLRPQEWSSSDGKNRQVVARVLDLRNDVNRQEEGRLLWSAIRKGDEIYLGDKIKTAGLSSTTIQFADSSSKLEIEENSMIVMSQGGKKLSLNMLEGRVFLQQEEGSGEQTLDLMSGGKKLDLKGDAAISVSKDGASQIESFSQGQSLFTELKPNYSEDILSPKNDMNVAWKASGRQEVVSVFIGESPLLMKKVEGIETVFSNGKLDVPMKPGINYWQLVTKVGEEEIKSPLMKLNLIRPLPPSPLFPSDKELIKAGERPFDFKWIKGNAGDTVVVEIAKDPDFRQMMFTQEIKDQTFFTPSSNLPQGEFFWRVKSRFGKNEWIESKSVPFTVHQGSNLLSPTPLSPADNAIFYVGRTPTNMVKFEWRKQDNVRGYELKVQGDNFNRETQLAESSTSINMNTVGKYTWEVNSESADGKKSVFPVRRKFEIREEGKIQWLMAQRAFYYLDSLPIIILKWEKKTNGVSILEISPSPDLREAESFQVQGRDFPYRALRDGTYFAKVSTLDESGETAAESELLEFKVEQAPVPPAPILAGETNKLKATAQGDLRTIVANAKASWLIVASLTDANGRVVDERRFSDDKLVFSGLLPGKYILQAKFQDEYRRGGEMSERIEVDVPEKSMLAAPKIKGIKIR